MVPNPFFILALAPNAFHTSQNVWLVTCNIWPSLDYLNKGKQSECGMQENMHFNNKYPDTYLSNYLYTLLRSIAIIDVDALTFNVGGLNSIAATPTLVPEYADSGYCHV